MDGGAGSLAAAVQWLQIKAGDLQITQIDLRNLWFSFHALQCTTE